MWKVFTGDFPLPIERGSKTELLHYVYLDDKACFAVFSSEAYSHSEIRTYWPWDFNHQGHIKQGRKNRGRAVYNDDSCTEYAKAPLRGNKSWSNDDGKVAILGDSLTKSMLGMASNPHTPSGSADNTSTPKASVQAPKSTGALNPFIPQGERAAMFQGPEEYSRKPVSLPPRTILISPYQTVPRTSSAVELPANEASLSRPALSSPGETQSNILSASRVMSNQESEGNLVHVTTKLDLSKAYLDAEDRSGSITPSKRSHDATNDKTSPPKHPRSTQSSPSTMNPMFSYDSACDDSVQLDNNDEDSKLEKQLKFEKLENNKLRRTQNDIKDHLAIIKKERDAFRHAAMMMLFAAKSKGELALSDRAAALQTLSDNLQTQSQAIWKLAKVASRQIQPTSTLCEAIGTVLGEEGGYMYDIGMDEEWKTLKEDAMRQFRTRSN
ncbi:hypothetical protein K469DRAFT_754666 [Zopfia rhizophila CBS 207.26]|uniref:Uncharacterized protein n=1 Tax=Zopfia rhizophila CBS 207.26 TaxID=1314779 RepID=A0A6A6DHG9_9PEZI|nr:hypothetical protein K469DRAFT_754666 [Zopfia rhizophila CBS 207.26]